ncbi:protein translocase subunit yidC [Hypnocyclicus thermotrophus]|uniref:Protein translocase subunit yidC n=1 Tax=Hypnocyclicus thermotrophus TaxID=1627895 RepID=A0AA46DYA4_9FUSO|nr:YidC/Oxa1 family membrane protein insertase [Hypnocyclicus thermotrophus]TDT69828.1 protein translocase subunit yidC [Hypnocyclicus thermotrophus]
MSIIQNLIREIILMIYNVTKSYGLAIIGVTLLIKLILLPLTLKQDKAMKDMKKIQPEIDKLREKYKDDPQELNKQTMELYKEHKVNPFGSCLPLLIQLPFLWGIFGVLKQTPEAVTNVNFLFWNLTKTDPYYVLPVLNALVTFFQQKVMSNSTTQNDQMKAMQYTFPIMILFFSLSMPTGLQLYWLLSSLISTAQQYFLINKGDDKGENQQK